MIDRGRDTARVPGISAPGAGDCIPDRSWARGSPAYFRREWDRIATQSSFIFPRRRARSQWDAFELPKAEAMLDMVQRTVSPGARILEYGCGAAGILIFLANHGYRGTALDVTRQALTVARANERAEGDSARRLGIQYVAADAMEMPFSDATFDCVVSNGLLEHFSPGAVQTVLKEVVRVLRPGGLFIADIAHARLSARSIAMPVNFLVSYVAAAARGQRAAAQQLWQQVSAPMYENHLGRVEWSDALERAGLADSVVRAFRLTPPLSLPSTLDRWYGIAISRLQPLRWAVRVHSKTMPLGWVYLATGVKQ